MQPSRDLNKATLLLGPTGSGKTPLGELIEQRGLWGADYLHFDFGENLREIVANNQADGAFSQVDGAFSRADGAFSRADIDLLGEMLATGALLEDEHFPIARRVLLGFMTAHRAGPRTCILLNGLPRHIGQATAIEAVLEIRAVIHLRCSPETVFARIDADTGGDRAGRVDDDLEAVAKKLAIFERRTEPLLQHYGRRGVEIHPIDVSAHMTPDRMWRALQGH